MAGVPEKVLNWLYSVLPSEYADVNRTYHDVAETLSAYPSLRPRTEVYTYENGASALLLQISGTIPVVFRGSSYGFPVQIWVPHAYPRESPMVYVIPSQDMLVRPGQHVSGDGRVYHPYLARWGEFWDKSTLYDFLAVLKGVFAKEPPVRSKVQQQPAPQAPPPVPPTPAEWRRSMQNPSVASGSPGPPQSSGAPVPPPKPPKPYEQGGPSPRPQSQVQQDRYSQPPPLPPHPTQPPHPPQNQYQQPQRNSYAGQSNWQQQGPPQQHGPPHPQGPPQQIAPRQGNYDISPATPVARPPQPHVQSQNYPPQPYNVGSPVSPITPENQRAPNRQYQQPAPPPQPHPPNFPQPQQHHHPQTQPPPHPSYVPPPVHPSHQLPHSYPPQFQQPPPQPAPPPPNLMDMDTLEVTLPSQSGPQHPTSVPPVPPNPEKDALLSALSSTLVASTRRTVEQNLAAVAPLQAQQAALQTARAKLTAELEQMGQLEKALEKNEAILRETMHTATLTMTSARTRPIPDVDDILVAPTVVGNQLYDTVAEERAIAEAIFVLGRAMDRGRVGADVFVRQTRGLAREMFLKKALGRKIARGVGLEVYS